MEGVLFDWGDYLSREGLSDVTSTGPSFRGGQAGQDGQLEAPSEPSLGSHSGPSVTDLDSLSNHLPLRMIQTGHAAERPSTPARAWPNQQLAGQNSFQNATAALEHNVYGSQGVELLGAPPPYDTVTVRDQYGYHSTSQIEASEAGTDQAPSRQAQVLSTPDSQELRALVPDQVCTCAVCLDGYRCPPHLEGFEGHPERNSWTFGCRVTGCQWTTKDDQGNYYNNLENLIWHEYGRREVHYGKPGDWKCQEIDCKFVTKRWSDFKRHSSSKHCIKPQNFECPVLTCKYHQTGFTHKDKLKSHYQNVHKGEFQPGKSNQHIKPKADGVA